MTEEQIEEAAKEYSGLTDNPKDSYSRVKGSLCIAFKDGAYWCIKSVWHDASETPEIVKLLLVEKENGNVSLCRVYKNHANTNGWKRWAYIEDLLYTPSLNKK